MFCLHVLPHLDEQEHKDQKEHMQRYLPKSKHINPDSAGAGASAKGWLWSSSSFHSWNSESGNSPSMAYQSLRDTSLDWQGTAELLHGWRQWQSESQRHEWGRGPHRYWYILWRLFKGKVLQENQIVWGAERLLKINKSSASWRFSHPPSHCPDTLIVWQYFTVHSLMPMF